MQAFVINLATATDRWVFVHKSITQSSLCITRVAAVDAMTISLPHPAFAARQYRWFHGRKINPRELACYLSHLKALQAFLDTGEEHGLVAEDDIVLRPDFDSSLAAALQRSNQWNILRLTGLSAAHPMRVARLAGDRDLCVHFGRLKGAGAYVVDRTAARALLKRLLPMRLPFDHAIDREWRQGLTAASIFPFPVSQTESDFLSSVQPGTWPRLSRTRRYLTTYPYQALNEVSRWFYRGFHALRIGLGHPATAPSKRPRVSPKTKV
ncbi:MAG: glycosyltransferase family 25 protein [Chthoniobacterales bacterium]